MSRMYTLGWNKYPPELDYADIYTGFDNSSSYCSNRNRSQIVNPSRAILKALYYMLPGDNCLIESVSRVDKPNDCIQIELRSKTSSGNYVMHYEYTDTGSARLTHDCPAINPKRHCYHSVMALAIADIHLNPDGAFSEAFADLVSGIEDNNIHIGSKYVLAQDELYCDFVDGIVPFDDDKLEIVKATPMQLPAIQNLYPFGCGTANVSLNIDVNVDYTTLSSTFSDAMDTISRYT